MKFCLPLLLLMGLATTGCSAGGVSPLASTHPVLGSHGGGSTSTATVGTTTRIGDRNISIGAPKATNGEPEIFISRDQYVISWNASHRELNWSAWQLTSADMGTSGRSNTFAPDPDLERYLASHGGGAVVQPTDYTGSCFDRGHQTPSADRTDSTADNQMTFFMSNMIPQTAYLNRVIWEHLENYERSLVKSSGNPVYIFAGPIFSDAPGHIGPNSDIAVPSKDFKIVVELVSGRPQVMAAVIMPNVTSTGTDPVQDHQQACMDSQHMAAAPSSNDWEQYKVQVGDIEQAAGLDFGFLTGS